MDSSNLQRHGLDRWFPFTEEVLSQIPRSTGVYVLRTPNAKPFGRLRGYSDILYIGSSEASLKRRLRFYFHPGPTQRTSIRINRMLKTYEAEVSWIQNEEPKTLETKLINTYFEEHDELPPFNAQSGASDHEKRVKEAVKPIKRITNKDKILELITKSSDGLCDDCLSSRAGIRPRQTVNIVARTLASSETITRIKRACPGCGAIKIVNKKK